MSISNHKIYIGIIPARGGSVRVKDKNIREFAGKPLIAHTCEAALKSGVLQDCFVSTDSQEIADIAKKYGAKIPFLRPTELAAHETPMIPVLQHFIKWFEKEYGIIHGLVLLQPTSPLRTAMHIREAVRKFEQYKAPSLVSVTKLPEHLHPKKMLDISNNHAREIFDAKNLPKEIWVRNGPAIVITDPKLIEGGVLYGNPNIPFEMSFDDSIDINDEIDFKLAESTFKQR